MPIRDFELMFEGTNTPLQIAQASPSQRLRTPSHLCVEVLSQVNR
jgi:hypothetical protein